MPLYTPASTPESTPPWDPYGPRLIVHVGSDSNEQIFSISQSMASFYSGYFHTLTAYEPLPQTAATTTTVIRLPSEDPEIFALALQYLQFRTFAPPPPPPPAGPSIAPQTQLSWDQLIALYILSTKRHMPLLQNATTDLFAHKAGATATFPDRWSLAWLWEETAGGSALRRLVVALVREMWIPTGHRGALWSEEMVEGRSEDAERLVWAVEGLLAEGRRVRVSARMVRRVQGCEWHVHEEGVFCEGSEEARLGIGGFREGC